MTDTVEDKSRSTTESWFAHAYFKWKSGLRVRDRFNIPGTIKFCAYLSTKILQRNHDASLPISHNVVILQFISAHLIRTVLRIFQLNINSQSI
jgi:hypothetical protein